MIRFRSGNRVTLLKTGAEFFPALERAIEAAQNEVYLETYIFANDSAGQRIAHALKQAALRGVRVQVLIDGFGSNALPKPFMDEMRGCGVKLLVFRPELGRFLLKRYRLRRLHRKICVVDTLVAFVGGINIIDDLSQHRMKAPRFDYAVAIEGPLIADILVSVRRLWTLISWLNFRRKRRYPFPEVMIPAAGKMRAAFLIRDNFKHRWDIEDAYLDAISNARQEIILANSYFLPGVRFRHALIDAAQRGVRVVLLLQGRVEYFFQHFATRALYGELLAAGIEIHEYYKSYLHAKVAVVDGEWATVGSSNIDPFSLLLAREANVVVQDAEFTATLRNSLLEAIRTDARQILPEKVRRQGLHMRLVCWLCYGGVRAMMGMAGYAIDQDHLLPDA